MDHPQVKNHRKKNMDNSHNDMAVYYKMMQVRMLLALSKYCTSNNYHSKDSYDIFLHIQISARPLKCSSIHTPQMVDDNTKTITPYFNLSFPDIIFVWIFLGDCPTVIGALSSKFG